MTTTPRSSNLVRAWRLALACALATALEASVAWGQADPPPAPPGSLESVPEQIEPGPPIGSPEEGETLSDRLEESGGVIKPPPGVDPGLVEEPPDPGLFPTPVIPPGTQTPEAAPR
jgi:hypothetical protein